MRSIGAPLNYSQQGGATVRNAIRAAMPVPDVKAGNGCTPYAAMRQKEIVKQ